MMASFIRVGGLMADVPPEFDTYLPDFLRDFGARCDEYEDMLTANPLRIDRTRGLGAISAEEAIDWGMTGPSLPGSRANYDVRRRGPSSGHAAPDFSVPRQPPGAD